MAILSQLDIVNQALIKLGVQTISSLTDESEQARVVTASYNMLLHEVLSSAAWSFAIKQKELHALAEPPLFRYSTQYLLPSDCIKLLEVHLPPKPVITDFQTSQKQYAIQNNKILTNVENGIGLVYVSDAIDPSEFSSSFSAALACKIAAHLSEALTAKAGMRDRAERDYQTALARAKKTNNIAKARRSGIDESSWMAVRMTV